MVLQRWGGAAAETASRTIGNERKERILAAERTATAPPEERR